MSLHRAGFEPSRGGLLPSSVEDCVGGETIPLDDRYRFRRVSWNSAMGGSTTAQIRREDV